MVIVYSSCFSSISVENISKKGRSAGAVLRTQDVLVGKGTVFFSVHARVDQALVFQGEGEGVSADCDAIVGGASFSAPGKAKLRPFVNTLYYTV